MHVNTLYSVPPILAPMFISSFVFHDHVSHRMLFIMKMFCNHVEIKCQLDATEVFIADLIACSTCFGHHYVHHQELKSIIQ